MGKLCREKEDGEDRKIEFISDTEMIQNVILNRMTFYYACDWILSQVMKMDDFCE